MTWLTGFQVMIKQTLTCSAVLVCIAIKHKGRESAAETNTLCFLLSGIASIFLVTSFLFLNKILLLQGGVTLKCPAFSVLRSSTQHVPRHCLLLSHAGPVTHKLISSEILCSVSWNLSKFTNRVPPSELRSGVSGGRKGGRETWSGTWV